MTIPPTDTVPPNPFVGLARSRAFWLLILDTVVTTILFFAGKYAGAALDDIKFLLAVYQPVFGVVITKMTFEDVARVQAAAKVQVAAHEASAAIQVAELAAPEPQLEERTFGEDLPERSRGERA